MTAPTTPDAEVADDPRRILPASIDEAATSLVARLAKTAEGRDLWLIGLFAAVVFIPWLGAVGLWDPWEGHYGEVAREMIWRHDYVYPYWESAYFFSKPVLLMWLTSLGMNLVGVNDPAMHQPVPTYTEWFMRMPIALLATAGAVVLSLAVRRIFGRRLAFLTAFVLCTSPHYFFLARQCIPDMPLVACLEIAMGAFLIAEFTLRPGKGDDAPAGRASPMWWYLMYAFAGFATLAKESLGIVLPGIIIATYLLISGEWAVLKRARLLPGALTFLLVCGPWYGTLLLFHGKDDEGSTFALRLLHDNFDRFFEQVHTTTPAWTFVYFIEQLGWGFFPWIALLPGAAIALGRIDRRSRDPQVRATLFFAGWAVVVFAFFTASGTKFHQYIFPVFPALAFIVALFIDRLWREGVDRQWFALLAGLATFGLIGSGLYRWHDDMGEHSGLKHFTDLFVYNYTRPYPFGLDHPETFMGICVAGGVVVGVGLLWKYKGLLFAGFGGMALLIALWGSWFYWRAMSHHWSQRDEFTAFYKERLPNEPITGYILGAGWRGETFYARNTIKEMNDPQHLLQFLNQPGPEFVIVEQARFTTMQQQLRQLAGDKFHFRIVDRSSNKFFLVEVD
jgi:4-amino-4-deoxy-L-arabinose transferase-like glycosyltransferase